MKNIIGRSKTLIVGASTELCQNRNLSFVKKTAGGQP